MKLKLMIFLLLWEGVASAHNTSLAELQKSAFENNKALKASEIQVDIKDLEISEAKSHFYPKIGIEYKAERLKSASEDLDEDHSHLYFEMNLFNKLHDRVELQTAKIEKLKAKKQYKQAKFELGLYVERLYYLYLYLDKSLEQVKKALARNQVQTTFVQRRFKSGLITEADLLEFKLQKARLGSKNDYLQLRASEIKDLLVKTVVWKDNHAIKIVGELPHLSLKFDEKSITDGIETNNKDLSVLSLNIEQLKEHESHAYWDWLPKVDLEFRQGRLDTLRTGLEESESSSVVLAAKWEFFSGFNSLTKKKSNQAKRIQAEYLWQNKLRVTRTSALNLFQKMKMLEKRIHREEQNEKLAALLYRKTLKEYKKGIKDSGALSSASANLSELSESIYQLKLTFLNSKLDLEQILGRKVATQELKH